MYETLREILQAYVADEEDDTDAFSKIHEFLNRKPQLKQVFENQVLASFENDEVLIDLVIHEANRSVNGMKGAKDWLAKMYKSVI